MCGFDPPIPHHSNTGWRAIMRRLEWSTIMDLQWLLRNLPERATEPPPGCLHLGSPSRLAFALSSPAPFFLWPGGWGSPFPVSWQLPFFATASARADGLSLLLGNTTLLPCSRRAHFFLPYNGSLCFTFVRQRIDANLTVSNTGWIYQLKLKSRYRNSKT